MSLLDELSSITKQNVKDEIKLKQALLEERKKLEKKEYEGITSALVSNLKEAAAQRQTQYSVFKRQIVHPDLSNIKIKDNMNCGLAWINKKITEEDIKEKMTGNFKLIYEYCDSLSLQPKIRPYKERELEGFEIYIDWKKKI